MLSVSVAFKVENPAPATTVPSNRTTATWVRFCIRTEESKSEASCTLISWAEQAMNSPVLLKQRKRGKRTRCQKYHSIVSLKDTTYKQTSAAELTFGHRWLLRRSVSIVPTHCQDRGRIFGCRLDSGLGRDRILVPSDCSVEWGRVLLSVDID